MFEREDKTKRFFVNVDGPDDEAVKEGFAWLVAYAVTNGYSRAALIAPALRSVDNMGRSLGAVAVALKKHRSVSVSGLTVELFTDQNVPYYYEHGPVLAVWTRDKSLEKLDGIEAPALCAVPWQAKNIAGWRQTWNPVDLRTGEGGGSDETVRNPVVREALESLSAVVNVSSGLGHPDDMATAVDTFRVLKRGGETYDPGEIRAWAARSGWSATDARELGEVAAKVKQGRGLRPSGQSMLDTGALARWRAGDD
jgi:hypothetical protein